MKANNFLYKALSALILLCCGSQVMWGQFTTGNRYISVGEEEFRATLQSGTGWDEGGRNPNDYENAYDQRDNTYAEQANQNTNATLTFSLNGNTLTSIQFLSDSDQYGTGHRPQQLIVESSNSNGGPWTPVQTFDFTRLVPTEHVALNAPITSNYVRLTFVANKSSASHIVQIYELSFYDNTNSATIQHKDAKWFDLREQLGLSNQSVGSFDWNQKRFDASQSLATEGLQAAHTYIDTIYMHKGASIMLALPTNSETGTGGSSSVETYQRWYSYRTDGTFETSHNGDVYDLLTPNGTTNVYRFTNGYVGRPLGDVAKAMNFYYPTNEEFEQWFPDSKVDNDWFIVACDVSGYTDFSEHFTSKGGYSSDVSVQDILDGCENDFINNGYYEPTIAVRVLFYIVGVDDRDNTTSTEKENNWNNGHGRLSRSEYQDGGTGPGKRYLEEYDITFPAEHLSNRTPELVALSKDARSYAIPGAGADEHVDLNVSLARTDSPLQLITTSLSGDGDDLERIIQFKARNADGNAPWEVADGTTETILVTKTYNGTTYNIARFNLTFEADALPLTQTQVSLLGTEGTEAWKKYTFRSPEWMDRNLQKLTEQTFDFDPDAVARYGQDDYFHFPLAWDNSSYAFFDGSPWQDFASRENGCYTINNERCWYPEFGYYAITNDYIGYGDQGGRNNIRPPKDDNDDELAKGASTYHIYVDASDRPGILARLPFNERLCVGSELYVTAWMKSACENTSNDGAVLFTVFGVSADGTETPLYRHSSSQIHQTTYLTAKDPGTGGGTNEWYQLYFSFINNNEEAADYVSYILQVENNCASTAGGDYYLDDITVYLMQPTATVTQKEYTCTNERTHMNIEMDWERLTSRLGGEGGSGEKGIDFCFIDETVYNNAYNEYIANNGGDDADAETVLAAKTAAVQAALVNVGDGEIIDTQIMSLYFNETFENNTVYGVDGKTFAYQNYDETTKKAYFYRTGSESDAAGRRLAIDFYSVLSPNRPYLMLILPVDINTGTIATAEDFAMMIGDPCNIQTRFYVASETLIKVNGEVVNPSTDFCEGQVFNFSAQLRYPTGVDDENGNEIFQVIENGVYFDWFFGSEQEFIAANETYGGVSLESALLDFRHFYPDATELSATNTPPTFEGEGDGRIEFSQNDYDIILHYLSTDIEEGGINQRLVLHRENLDITLLEDGLELVVFPIRTLIPPSDAGLSPDQWANICWEYVPLVLTTNDRAPQLYAGFNTVQYPANDFAPDLRIGLAQIRAAQSVDNAIRVDLRGAQMVTDGATHLGLITAPSARDDIYLIGSDDPQYSHYFASEDFNRYSLPIGKIHELFVEEYVPGSSYDDHMNITFNLEPQANGFQFNPREGYTYMFSAYFEEKSDDVNDVYNACYGSLNIEMKVVPENLVWQGTEKDNWNNDANWKRADASDLKIEDGSYTTNDANTTSNGFVPMLFSNVIMPAGSKAELYMAGYTDGGELGNGDLWAGSTNRPDGMGDPTENIQYDLMVYEANNALTTQRYRVNICRDIHFMPDAQMLHAEQLIYTNAWMDVKLPTRTWTLVSVPLNGVYSGDWYTATSGTQADETYFTPIIFTDGENSRSNPSVYQRSWNSGATIVQSPINAGNGTVGFTNVSSPVWSATFNDASVPYYAGQGFSLSARDVSGGTGTLCFRFPKADTSYAYSTTTGGLDRTNSGKLLISGLLDRSTPTNLVDNGEVTTGPLTVSQDGKYMIVGNPYMAPLDLKKFFEANNENLTGSYWTETLDGASAGGFDEEDDWATTGEPVIQPYGAFFVEKKSTDAANTVKFTADMQKFDTDGSGTVTTNFTITAENGSGHSGAVLVYADDADNNYNAVEDVQLMRNILGNNANELSVYTVAGNTATSVNRIKDLRQVPLGLFAADSDVTTLTFTGVAALLEPSLYDAVANTDTPLTEGYKLTVDGASHGRYFLRAKGAGAGTTGISETVVGEGNDVNVYSMVRGQVVVSSTADILDVTVYSVGGSLICNEKLDAGHTACTLNDIESGIAIVKVKTSNGVKTCKVMVR